MDPIGLAAAAGAAGAAAGLAVISSTVAIVGLLRPPGAAPGAEAELAAPLAVLLAGTFGGLLLAGVVTWRLLAPVGSTYRRGGLALVSAFATVVLMLVCMPLDHYLGRPGLLALALAALVAAVLLARRARRIGAAA